jgi:hypothetical protein
MNKSKVDRIVRFTVAIGLATLAVYYIWLISTRSADSRAYYPHGSVEPWRYPTEAVLVSCALVLVEAGVLWAVLARPRAPLWKKSLFALGLALPGALGGIGMLMHSPPYFGFHVFWLVTVVLCLVVLFLVSGVVHLTSAILRR